MTFVIDIDDTILYSAKIECTNCNRIIYELQNIDRKEIELINDLYEKGHVIILHTGRNWDCYNITKNQLEKVNVKYHELVMGKPQGVYIDKDSYRTISNYLEVNNG